MIDIIEIIAPQRAPTVIEIGTEAPPEAIEVVMPGTPGARGAKGDKGDKGDQGIQGLKGDKGEQGIQGIQGFKGDRGDQGVQGNQGIQGLKGDKGDQGIPGPIGPAGGSVSPAFTGTPTAPTAAASDNSTILATTGHVKAAIVAADLAPAIHKHAITDVNGLQAALDARVLPGRLGAKAFQNFADWNECVDNGWYMNSAAANAPIAGDIWFLGHVQAHGGEGWCTQIVHAFAKYDDNNTGTYRRQQRTGVWSAWTRVLMTQTELDARFPQLVHKHAIGDVNGLQTAIDAKLNLAGGTLSGQIIMTANKAGNAAIAAQAGETGEVSIRGNGTGPAMMSFHRPGSYAAHFGLDVDNQWKVGGWSTGSVSYKLWHEGNFTPSNYATTASPTFSGTVTAPKINMGASWGGSNWLALGNGDAASYTTFNMEMRGWWGLGMSTYDGSINGYYDFRAGKWDTKGGFFKSGVETVYRDGATYSLSITGNSDTVDGLHAASFLRGDTTNGSVRMTPGDGNGVKFWDGDIYSISMSSKGNTTWGGDLNGGSDYNMYFRMGGGAARGFVFKNDAVGPIVQFTGAGDILAKGALFLGGSTTSARMGIDGNIYMPWASDWLSNVLGGKAAANHTHTIANITSLQTTLDAKAPLTATQELGPGITMAYATTFNIPIPADGDAYELITKIVPSADCAVVVQFSYDGGTNWIGGSTDYFYHGYCVAGSTFTAIGGANSAYAVIYYGTLYNAWWNVVPNVSTAWVFPGAGALPSEVHTLYTGTNGQTFILGHISSRVNSVKGRATHIRVTSTVANSIAAGSLISFKRKG